MSLDQAATATRETSEVANQGDLVRLWIEALGIAASDEENWRKRAVETVNVYRQSKDKDKYDDGRKFNILHSNIETVVPALYNSTPAPDVRRRFDDPDPQAKLVAEIQERCLSYTIDSYDFDQVMIHTVKDAELTGRGVTRVRYRPYADDDDIQFQEVVCEHVPWKHFRRGPANTWDELPWIAFELFLTRDDLLKLSSKHGGKVTLDVTVNGVNDDGDGHNVNEVFKRARVWEIWDKDRREVVFVADGYKDAPIRIEKDPLDLEGFFPIPRPLYGVQSSDSLVPIVPYDLYRAQAEELEQVSRRISTLTNAVKARALYDGRLESEMARIERGDDADNVAIDNLAIFADGSKLADHVMFYPIDIIVAALKELFFARDQIKQTIYEITGIADILRGQSDPNETLGAQQIKQQWGSLRIQHKQREVQRYARDLFRMKAEIFASKFEPKVLEIMTGISLIPSEADDPQAAQVKVGALELLRTEKVRGFRVDIESDSTIRADMSRSQQQMTLFLQGTAEFATALGPLVQQDHSMLPAVMEVYSAFARHFKLGRQAEAALDSIADQSKESAKQPQPPSPEVQAQQAKLQADVQKMQLDAQMQQQKASMDMQMAQQEHQMKMELMQAELQQKAAELQMKEREMAMKERQMMLDSQLKERQAHIDAQAMEHKSALDDRTAALQAEQIDRKHEVGLEMLDAKAKAAKQPRANA